MSTQRFTPEFKEEAVKQVVERGYSVPDIAAQETRTDIADYIVGF
jgi:transposase-like protein